MVNNEGLLIKYNTGNTSVYLLYNCSQDYRKKLITEAENNDNYVVKLLKKLTKIDLISGRQIIVFIDNFTPINSLNILQHETRNLNFVGGEYLVTCYNHILINNIEMHPLYLIHDAEQFISLIIKIFSKSFISSCLFRNSTNLTIDTIINDIHFFKSENQLTSRLAICIYKLYTFDFNASSTQIGSDYAKIYGKSKNISSKKYGISNVKGYVVSSYAHPIRIDIAKRLLPYLANLSDYEIAEITGLDLKLVMYLRGTNYGNM